METWIVIVIVAAVVAAILVIAILVMRSKRQRRAVQTAGLREGFGPEYEKAVEEQGRSGGEEDLLKRQERADLLHVRPLSAMEMSSLTERWTATQAQFVDDPGAAMTAADHLVGELISARGYPAGEFEEGASALSVDHPRAVQEYRAAHEIAQRNQRNPVATDDLRAAMMQYDAVFAELMKN
jgi:hypothetical protein